MDPTADLILHNARIITLDRSNPMAAAVAIRGSRFLAVGSEQDIALHKGSKTEVINCLGRTVLPGFNDAHCHPIATAASLLSVDCSPASVRSIGEIQERILERARRTPKGRWIRATGYNEFYLAEKRHPNRWDLDRAAPDHPVKLSHRSGHACILNSRAMETVGISAETEAPDGGMIERDLETGEPNGLLFEMNTYVDRFIPPLSDGDLEKGFTLLNETLLSYGITSVQDATWDNSYRRWQLLRRMKEQKKLLPRISMMIGTEALDDLSPFESGTTTDHMRLGAVKIVIHRATGSLHPPQDQLNHLSLKAHLPGLQLAFHADEAVTVEAAVTALEYALAGSPRPNHRHRLEHCSVCPPHLMQRLKKTGAIVVTQPPFIYYSGERYLATVPPEDLKWLYAIGSLRANGIKVASSSDAPVVDSSPLIGIYASVTRKTMAGQTVLPRENISIVDALESYTVDAAYASFEEDIKGSISRNKLADLVVLSEDPTATPPDQIKDIQPLMTIIDGKVVWQKK